MSNRYNRYLEKLAGLPGSFLTTARMSSVRNLASNKTKQVWSGLPVGPAVSGAKANNMAGRTSTLTPANSRTGFSLGSLGGAFPTPLSVAK